MKGLAGPVSGKSLLHGSSHRQALYLHSFVVCLLFPFLSPLIPGWPLTDYVPRLCVNFDSSPASVFQVRGLQEWTTMSDSGIKQTNNKIITFTKVSCSGTKNSPKHPFPNSF